jgi:hypothetical protein
MHTKQGLLDVQTIQTHQKTERQYNGQKEENKRTNIDLQNITQKTKHRQTLVSYYNYTLPK